MTSTTGVAELIERLREDAVNFKQHCVAADCTKAADLLSRQAMEIERAIDDALESARQRAIVLFQAYARGVTMHHGRSEEQFMRDVEAFSGELADALRHPISRKALSTPSGAVG